MPPTTLRTTEVVLPAEIVTAVFLVPLYVPEARRM